MTFESSDDKDFAIFATPTELSLDNFFDLSLDYHDTFESSDASNEGNFFDDLSMGSAAKEAPPPEPASFPSQSTEYQPNHSWRTDLWRQHKVPIILKSQKSAHRSRPEALAITGAELLSLEGKRDSPHTPQIGAPLPPATPPSTILNRRPCPTTPGTSSQRVTRPSKTPTRTALGSLDMTHSSTYYAGQESPSFSDWTKRFERINLQPVQNTLPLSPPPSAKLWDHERPTRLTIPASNDIFSSPPLFDQSVLSADQSPFLSGDNNYSSIPISNPLPWSSTSPVFSFPEQWTSAAEDPFGPLISNTDLSRAPDVGSGSALDLSFATQGLMIDCNGFGGGLGSSSALAPGGDDDFLEKSLSAYAALNDEDFNQTSPYTTRALHAPSNLNDYEDTPPLTMTPTTPSKRRSRYDGSTGKRSTSRTPRTPKTPRTPRTPGTGSGLGFVNFTPQDSRKILTGVAPSGSSKTKARREREANEKARKFNEALIRRLKDKGHDPDILNREEFFDS